MKKLALPFFIVLLATFGLITLFLSGSVIFDLFGMREKEGNFVPFVVAANFFVALGYLASLPGFYGRKNWAVSILFIAALLLLVTFAGLMVHINTGGVYETKTVGALLVRIALAVLFAFLGRRLMMRKKNDTMNRHGFLRLKE